MVSRRTEIFLEFLLLGVCVGIIEDLLAIWLVTNEPFNWRIVGIAAAVAIPFAFLGEVIVDRKHLIPVRPKSKAIKRTPKTQSRKS